MLNVKIQNSKFKSNLKREISNIKFKFGICNFVFILSFLFWIFNFNSSSLAQDKISAIVNNEVITQKDLDDFINYVRMQLSQDNTPENVERKIEKMKPDLLDRLIEDRLLIQEAKRSEIKIDPDRIKERIAQMKMRYHSDKEFQDSLAAQGLVEADIQERIKEQLYMYNLIEGKIKPKVKVNPEEVTDFYYKNIENFTISEERDFEYIIFDDEAKAQDAAEKLKNNRDWNEVAKKYSLTINKLSGRLNGELKKDIEDAVFKLKKDEASDVVRIGDKFYIFKVNNIVLFRQQSLSEVQDSIYSLLRDRKMQEEMVKFIDELKKKAYIKKS